MRGQGNQWPGSSVLEVSRSSDRTGAKVTDQPSPESEPFEQVLLVVSRGDRDAEFSAFMAAAAPALGRMALSLCGDAHRAEELVQQAFVRTYVAWGRARDGDPLIYARR
ncbi:MAG: SigE family RNA polymerase sigma factor, partial [Cellulomonadaceae bacterium]|nr:SigE family RNA polymerase sigma factor [Cellulomonadaceae bacterium]